jgi:hypothetical protein
LAGVAGLIVAVGVTADSFVVFYERIKDEVREGRTVRTGVDRAWIRARRTIISADTVSLLAAVALYLLGGWVPFVGNLPYSSVFICVTLLLAADFWAVKNVTGRLLVGLRWWNRIREDGSNEWVFESAPEGAPAADGGAPAPSGGSDLDRRIFWTALYLAPALFALFGFLHFFSLALDWFLVDAVAMGLLGANLVGYYRCSGDAQRRLRSTLAAGVLGALNSGAQPAGGGGGGGSSAANVLDLFSRAAAAAAAAGGAGIGGAAPGAGTGAGAAAGATGTNAAGGGTNSISDFDAVQDPFGYDNHGVGGRPTHARGYSGDTVPI